MQSHFQRHHPDLLVENVINANVVSQPAAVNAMFKATLPFSSPRATSMKKSIAGFSWKDFGPYSPKIKVSAKCCKHWSHGMEYRPQSFFTKITGKFEDAL